MGVVALIFGILGIGGGWIDGVQYFTGVLSILAIIFGSIARKNAKLNGQSAAMATAGMVLGIIAVVETVIMIIVVGVLAYWFYSIFRGWF